MTFKYYHGERKNPFESAEDGWDDDVRAIYWFREQFVSNIHNATEGILGYPCQIWPDFIQRARANLTERGLAFEIDYQNSKWGGGEEREDWHSYFAGPRTCWQNVPFHLPEVKLDQDRYIFTDYEEDGRVYTRRKLIIFGPIVRAVYRGVAEEQRVPIFEIENLRGDKLYVNTPSFDFRMGNFTVAGEYKRGEEDFQTVYVYDVRLHVALARLLLDETAPVICVGERLPLPTRAEAAREMKWYRLPEKNIKF